MALLCLAALLLPLGLVTALNVYLVALATLVMLARRQGLPPGLGPVLWPFVALIALAFLRGLGAETYIFLRDGWYFSNPLLVLLVGFVLGRQVDDAAKGLRAVVVAGTLVALLHLLWFVLFPQLLALRASEVRSVTGSGYFAPVVAVLILLAHAGHWRGGLRLAPAWAWPLLFINLASTGLAFSRTLTVVLRPAPWPQRASLLSANCGVCWRWRCRRRGGAGRAQCGGPRLAAGQDLAGGQVRPCL